jgi:uncharacterized protein YndB with AHSA1/START domain
MTDVRITQQAPGDDETLIFECDLADTPEKVWRALTVPKLVAAWLMPNDLCPEQGARFTFNGTLEEGGDIECEVLAVEPERLIRYSWRDDDARRHVQDSTVTFELARTTEGGTHLRIVHRGIQRANSTQPTMMAANSNQKLMMLAAA